ncbi:MAG TPA: tail fiber domain-containing protein [Chitinophagaceae bacterium]
MKKLLLLLATATYYTSHAQNVGIGTDAPQARLHVSDSNVVFTGSPTIPFLTTFDPPVQGPGIRMMWYPQKAAFRVGIVDGANWDKDNIGRISFVAGWNCLAIGLGSFASGYFTTASGDYSFASGFETIASGFHSFASGHRTIAGGEHSTSMGYETNASNYASTSMGYKTNASGQVSTSMGYETNASGNHSTCVGLYTKSKAYASFTAGLYNDDTDNPNPNFLVATDRIFQIGIGATETNRMNALTVLRNGTIGIGTTTPDAPLSFRNSLGKKITLYSSGPSNQFGIGILAGLLQIHSDVEGADIAFGYGSTFSFTERMRIKGSGKVGIGTTAPEQQFEVVGPASATPVTLVIGNRGGFGPAALEFMSDYGAGNEWRPGYIKSRDLGVYTGSLEFYTNGAGVANLKGNVKGFEVSNGFAYTATGTVLSWSDARLKNNITAFTDGLNVISKINPVKFYYNADAPFNTDQEQVGVVAQDLEKVAPYMIEKNKQNAYDDLRSVNNQAYTFLLINAIKEQQLQIESQQNKINKQEMDIEKLQAQINELKKLVEQLLKK